MMLIRIYFRQIQQNSLPIFTLCGRSTSNKTKSESKNVRNQRDKDESIFKGKIVIKGANFFRRKRLAQSDLQSQLLYVPPLREGDNWTQRWHAPHSFTTEVPLPLRQGYVKGKTENRGIIPGPLGNSELLKIPNFLHLTPAHIRKQCAAIKKFCTKWPEGLVTDKDLSKYYPVEVITRDYVMSSPSIRDERARLVTIRIPVDLLRLDQRALHKFKLLAGKHRIVKEEGREILVLKAERCPLRQQNYDYLMYVLTALTAESKKLHPWESEITRKDRKDFMWEDSESREIVTKLIQTRQTEESTPAAEEPVDALPEVAKYREALTDIMTEGEDQQRLENYKESVKALLGLKRASASG